MSQAFLRFSERVQGPRGEQMNFLYQVINTLIDIYIYVIIADVVMSWLVNFNIVNPYSPAIRAIHTITYRLTDPLLRPIRRLMPNLGGLDISPIILILGVEVVRFLINSTLFALT